MADYFRNGLYCVLAALMGCGGYSANNQEDPQAIVREAEKTNKDIERLGKSLDKRIKYYADECERLDKENERLAKLINKK